MFQVVLCNCPSRVVAEQIAEQLVTEQLVACVNLVPGITSVYQWQGKIEKEDEVMLLIKTTAEIFDELSARIEALHPYEVPEVIALDIQQGNNAYLDWIAGSLK
ncbi:divalent-cation tolerance protein CutA [Thalassotalea euphylliae]|uniref:Divalent-cation tolerance protein CutA n=1 Tax=Thalassotalea euphylliae TaxID=1655234 RepID=A0A3E0U4X3_9GAMM|nr:divalent-cation tolerance protein CutA [Thalassotalea euphylliae]REL31627.1 divalent-cation tolerance protein CutA [Thalassotalea euphylliae]REL36911.1 divalent-cation tolerance protein CutA [Thalassotalea euphylliae]